MAKVVIDRERCKACELCITFCPNNCIKLGEEMNAAGYFAAVYLESEDCKSCGLCAEMCPDMAIEVWK